MSYGKIHSRESDGETLSVEEVILESYDKTNKALEIISIGSAITTAVIQTASVIHATETVIGSEIDVSTASYMTIFFEYLQGDEDSVAIIPKVLRVTGGTEHPANSWSSSAGVKTVTANSHSVSTDGNHYIVLDVRGLNIIKLYEDATGGTPDGSLAVSYTLGN